MFSFVSDSSQVFGVLSAGLAIGFVRINAPRFGQMITQELASSTVPISAGPAVESASAGVGPWSPEFPLLNLVSSYFCIFSIQSVVVDPFLQLLVHFLPNTYPQNARMVCAHHSQQTEQKSTCCSLLHGSFG